MAQNYYYYYPHQQYQPQSYPQHSFQSYPQHHVQPVYNPSFIPHYPQYQPQIQSHPPSSSTYSQPNFCRPLPLPTPKRAETVPPPAATHQPRPPTAIPSSSFPSFAHSIPFTDPSQTRRPLPTPRSKHYSLDLRARAVLAPSWSDQETHPGRSRSESPVKITHIPSPSPFNPTNTTSDSTIPPLDSTSAKSKFVPLWKRAPNTAPNSFPLSADSNGAKRALPLSPDGTAGVVPDLRALGTSTFNNSDRQRDLPPSPTKYNYKSPHASGLVHNNPLGPNGRDSGRRPLPVAPEPESDPESGDSESEVGSSRSGEAQPSSPQYGILDLPRRDVGQDNTQVGSMTLRLAALELRSQAQQKSTSVGRADTNPAAGSQWPPTNSARFSQGTPAKRPLNRNEGNRRIDNEDLEDAPPPPSLPRPPSSTSQRWQQTESRGMDNWQHRRQPPPRWQPSTTPDPAPDSASDLKRDNRDNNSADVSSNNNTWHAQSHIESPSPMGGRDTRADIPKLEFPDAEESSGDVPVVNVQGPPEITVDGPPAINVSSPGIEISVSEPDSSERNTAQPQPQPQQRTLPPPPRRREGLVCEGCDGAIIGRIVSAIGVRWHPSCFKCTVCNELLEHVSSYEHEGRPYCHLDYHETFAPRCYTCKTAIIDERFITLDDPALGKRTYHEQHFFCAECGDPFLAPSKAGTTGRTGELSLNGDGDFADDDVGFTVYKGHPYCEACHVRLRMPKCKKCKKSIRDGMQAVEALGGKWCWGCFVCAGCEKPFEEPSFFQREGMPFCERCFTIILKNEL